MNDCIFCKIAAGQIPSATVYEDETFRVILDMNQAIAGHMLILPKEHYADLYELPEDTAAAAMRLAKKLAHAAAATMDLDGLNILQNNGEAAGQSVMHYHLHVLPRRRGDDTFPVWNERTASSEELTQTAETIRKGL
ncbi:MAG: HIT family protein [Lachnospiraceae bacterium]|nr:HIT family protein [Lachnospiraceae bacterium]